MHSFDEVLLIQQINSKEEKFKSYISMATIRRKIVSYSLQ